MTGAPSPPPPDVEAAVAELDRLTDGALQRPGPETAVGVVAACRALMVILTRPPRPPSDDEAAGWALERLPTEHRPLVEHALAVVAGADPGWDADALRRFRTFAVGAAVRRRPGRKVAGLP